MEQLLKRIYGRRSEKFNPNQLMMFEKEFIEALEGYGCEGVEEVSEIRVERKRSIKRKHLGRIPIPCLLYTSPSPRD